MTEQEKSVGDIAIAASGVSKMYPLYARPNDRLKQSLWYALPQFIRGQQPPEFYKEFWALRDISFEISQGETVGIVGRNGSGKSTLLQIIAGTLAPTQGEVQVNGRVAALLELGSGFNPEFTGRENVYLNGSILGLSQAEIDNIFDDIAAFADIGQFIDQPVKFYSSGMFVRLAFAVQTFVPKDIFIVDEALAVGDEAFQRKCMAALETFQDGGGTVLLVSHDTQMIVRQCKRTLLLSGGELLVDGPSKPVTDLYHRILYSQPQAIADILTNLRRHGLQHILKQSKAEESGEQQNGTTSREVVVTAAERDIATEVEPALNDEPADWYDPNMPKVSEMVYGNGDAEIIDCAMYNEQGQRVNFLVVSRRYRWVYLVRFLRDAYDVQFGMMLKTVDGLDIAGIASKREHVYFEHIPACSLIEVSFSFRLNVPEGTYFLNVGVDGRDKDGNPTYLHRRVDVAMIRVLPRDTRSSAGLAYLEPGFGYRFRDTSTSALGQDETGSL